MKIRLAKTAGFCMGVRRAVDMVLDLGTDSPPLPVVTYGPLIHNPQTLQILESKGIRQVVSLDDVTTGTVVIRAHGISPQERQALQDKGVTVVDATCPRVARVQAVIRKHSGKGHFCVIVGDDDHPEVKGLMGFASAGGLAVPSADDGALIDTIPADREICVVAQTTQELETFQRVVKKLRERDCTLHPYNTICDSTKKRQKEVSDLARQADLIVVVGGKGSGNTRRLVKVAQDQGVHALHVETEEEIPDSTLDPAHIVGVTAGASTPNWQIRRVIDRLRTIQRNRKGVPLKHIRTVADVAVMTYVPAALGGAGLAAACLTMQARDATWLPLLVTMLFVFSMHLLNRIQERSGAVRFNTPEISAFYVRHRKLLTTLGIGSALAAVALGYELGLYAFLLLLAMLVTGALYSVPLFPHIGLSWIGWRSLKEIPGLKTPLVAVGWAVACAVLPVIGSREPLALGSLAVAFTFAAGMVFWRTALSDLLDVQGDRIVGRATIPILTGAKRTRWLLEALLMLLFLVLAVSTVAGVIPAVGFWLVANVLFFGVFYWVYRRRPLLDRLLLEGMLDGNLFLAGALSMVYGMTRGGA
ncbi:MAG: 4-hydroxy-3-methylbut-2-enyl diphosphate reductase [Desulfomonile tiedjei]|nr:4-hydroxy-3-methylbut-2-enyl diphosphate reductase [Desulfomonile tiedjei]